MKMLRDDPLGIVAQISVWKLRIDFGNHFFAGWLPNLHKCELGDGWSVFHRLFSVHYFRSGIVQ
jgi:hypothetical protein